VREKNNGIENSINPQVHMDTKDTTEEKLYQRFSRLYPHGIKKINRIHRKIIYLLPCIYENISINYN